MFQFNFQISELISATSALRWLSEGLLISFIQMNGTSEILGNGWRCGIEKQGQQNKENIECIYEL